MLPSLSINGHSIVFLTILYAVPVSAVSQAMNLINTIKPLTVERSIGMLIFIMNKLLLP